MLLQIEELLCPYSYLLIIKFSETLQNVCTFAHSKAEHMRSFIFILFFTLSPFLCQAQMEVPSGNSMCTTMVKDNFTYCINSNNYQIKWTAIQIKGVDIEKKTYFPPDKEFFKDMPSSIDPIWQKIEQQTNYWAIEFDSVYVVTGTTTINTDTIKPPTQVYYKAILKGCQGDGLGFIVNEDALFSNLKKHALTLNELEKVTGLDFFPTLDKDLQEIFESEFSWEFWPVIE